MAEVDTQELQQQYEKLIKAAEQIANRLAESEGKPSDEERYKAHREKMAARKRAESVAARDIGELPTCKDPERRDAALAHLPTFLKTYLPGVFYLPFSPDHERILEQIQTCISEGGYIAMAMPRGSGKSAICRGTVLWAILSGRHLYAKLLGANDTKGTASLASIKTALTSNKLLAEDFPEACIPLRMIEDVKQKRPLYKGEPLKMDLSANQIVLPAIDGQPWAEAVIEAGGLLAGFRGADYARRDGRTVRPSLVIPDDPQTDKSARSPSDTATRRDILTAGVLGLAGPDVQLSVVMPCTVIKTGDLSDQLLDRERFPQWRGERTKMIYKLPDDLDLWEKYYAIRADGQRSGKMGSARKFYKEHQQQLEAGAVIAWPDRVRKGEVSGIQSAMHMRRDMEISKFEAEYNNDPVDESSTTIYLSQDEIATKVGPFKRGEIPADAEKLTMFIDVQQNLLYWMICSWSEGFTGTVVDYGTWPDQRSVDFTAANARFTLRGKYGGGIEGAITSGLQDLTKAKLGTAYAKTDGSEMWIGRCLVDRSYSTATVDAFCLACDFPQIIVPSRGRGISAADTPISDFRKKQGEIKRPGKEWFQPKPQPGSPRRVDFDSNWFKSFVQKRLATAVGDVGCVTLHGPKKRRHDFLALHLTAEFFTVTKGKNRIVEVWKMRPNRTENHWLDGLVGNAVAASMEGIELVEIAKSQKQNKKRKRRVVYG